MERGGYVYIMSNKSRSVLYIGVTSELKVRAYDHKHGVGSSFTKRYNCTDLVYFKGFPSIEEAIIVEKRMKKWKREYKMNVIFEMNPEFEDLFEWVLELGL